MDQQDHVWSVSEHPLHRGQLADQFTLSIPPTLPTGAYRVVLNVNDSRDIDLDTVTIDKDTRSYTAGSLAIAERFQVDMREIRLLGYTSIPATVAPGDLLSLGLYWCARGKPQGDYVVTVQLRDVRGQVALDQTARPARCCSIGTILFCLLTFHRAITQSLLFCATRKRMS
jgi:hypothetical protein